MPEPGEPMVGATVKIRRLVSKPELNGRDGIVKKWVAPESNIKPAP